ncbi:hypothetical protein DYB30_004578 [Aphanomyces astaci]|uniref:Golgin subfamily A member 7/ERF4 domain-containing protein n=1 Tax=Aphanomyces astaci TaxID=112090 RepID=A0A397DTW1_APHAT|nr:hypothetical protein DYB30_004578 [Aphanomyces astaci]
MDSEKSSDAAPAMAESIPRELFRVPAIGDVWVNGLSNEYDASTFPSQLEAYMTQEDYDKALDTINQALHDLWPCVPCWSTSYGCCVCTLGLSLYCAWGQVSEAETCTARQIARVNRRACFKDRHITWRLEKSWLKHTSWLVISVVE